MSNTKFDSFFHQCCIFQQLFGLQNLLLCLLFDICLLQCDFVIFFVTVADMVVFGQIVIGPPGSGKSTYCRAMHEFMTGQLMLCSFLYLNTYLFADVDQYDHNHIGLIQLCQSISIAREAFLLTLP